MNRKSIRTRLISLVLVLLLAFPAAVLAEGSASQRVSDLLETFMGYNKIPDLFSAAEKALAGGADPTNVKDALYTAADKKDLYPYFSYALENYVAVGEKSYKSLMKVLDSSASLDCDDSSSESYISSIGFDASDNSQASSAFKSMIGDSGAQFCASSYAVMESDFDKLYKTSFSKFVPSRPRPGYVCVVVQKGAKSWPNKAWSDDDEYDDFLEQFRAIISAVCDACGSSAPVITGNPNIASAFLFYNVSFTSQKQYIINNVTRVRGYNTTYTVTLIDASTKKNLSKYTETVVMRDHDLYWKSDNGVVKRADLPKLSNSKSLKALAKTLASEVKKQKNLASASRPITGSNAATVLAGILEAQAKDADAWESAIYKSGAADISMNGSEISFTLRSFDPKLKKIGAYSEAKNASTWLSAAAKNIAARNLKFTLKLSGGVPSKQSLSDMKEKVQKAAKSAKKAYSSSDMAAALKDYLFPAPLKKVSKYTKLLSPSDSFKKLFESRFSGNEKLSATLYSIICYGQKSLTVNVKNGPHKLGLTFSGIADPAKSVSAAANKIVKSMAALPVKERTALDKPEYTLLKGLAKTAYSAKDKFTLNVDADQLGKDTMPGNYTSYLNKFDIPGAVDSMTNKIKALPDIAAVEMPDTKLLSGGKTGKKVILKLPSGSRATYIQVRKKGTKEKFATMFIHPGKSVTFKLPVGDYYLVYCSGTYWYGEKKFFMEPDGVYYTDTFDIPKNLVRKEIELKPVDNGNIGVYSGSSDDLLK